MYATPWGADMTLEDYNFLTTTMSKVLDLNNNNETLLDELEYLKSDVGQKHIEKKTLDNELRDALESEGKMEELAESHLRVKEKWMTDCHELDAMGRTISQSVDSINRTEDLGNKISKYILIIGFFCAFVLSQTNTIPFDDISGVSSECSETGGTFEGKKYDSVELCRDREFLIGNCFMYMIIPILVSQKVIEVKHKKKSSQVRLIKPTEDEAASLGSRVRKGEKQIRNIMRHMKTIQSRLDLVKKLEKEIPKLENLIAKSEQKIVQGEKTIKSNTDEINELLEGVNHLTPYYDKLRL
jgi:chromosome segregation ATPase